MFKYLALLLALVLVLGGCGSDDGDGGGTGGQGGNGTLSCASLSKEWCARACSCTSGGECTLRHGTAVTETHDSQENCESFYVALGCQNAPTDSAALSACQTALAAAQCSPNNDALEFPDECRF